MIENEGRKAFSKISGGKLTDSLIYSLTNYCRITKMQNHFIKDIRNAISQNQFSIQLQPKFKMGTCEIESAECLIRWNHPLKGWIMPKDFISLAEEVNIIHEIDLWVLESIVKLLKGWKNLYDPIKISVNISAETLLQLDFCNEFSNLLEKCGVDPTFIEMELTERTMIKNEELVKNVMKDLQKMGITIALDDFGKGYSSVLYLDKYQFDTIKLDKLFLKGFPFEKKANLITKSIICLAHGLNLKVVAEGVENETQFHFLKQINCDIVQGYFFSKPISIEDFEAQYLRLKPIP